MHATQPAPGPLPFNGGGMAREAHAVEREALAVEAEALALELEAGGVIPPPVPVPVPPIPDKPTEADLLAASNVLVAVSTAFAADNPHGSPLHKLAASVNRQAQKILQEIEQSADTAAAAAPGEPD